jgi:hypothetical protein
LALKTSSTTYQYAHAELNFGAIQFNIQSKMAGLPCVAVAPPPASQAHCSPMEVAVADLAALFAAAAAAALFCCSFLLPFAAAAAAAAGTS